MIIAEYLNCLFRIAHGLLIYIPTFCNESWITSWFEPTHSICR